MTFNCASAGDAVTATASAQAETNPRARRNDDIEIPLCLFEMGSDGAIFGHWPDGRQQRGEEWRFESATG
jgi:hypothetical protein